MASLSITISWSSLRLMPIASVMPSSHLILCHLLLLLPPIPPSIRVFSNESTLRMRWPKYWGFGFSIIPSKEIPGLISLRMDWLEFFFTKVENHSVMSDSLKPHGLYSSWNSLGQITGVGSLSLLQRIFLTQESNWGLLHYRQIHTS